MLGERNASVAGNREVNLVAPNATIAQIPQNVSDPDMISMSYRPLDLAASNSWSITFAAQEGTTLQPGTYIEAHKVVFSPMADGPGFSLSGGGKGCSTSTADFTIHELTRDSDGNVLVLSASFLFGCGSALTPGYRVRGEVRFNSTQTWQAWTVNKTSLTFPGEQVETTGEPLEVSIAVLGTEAAEMEAGIFGTDASEFALLDPDSCLGESDPGATCTVEVTFMPSTNSTRSAELRISSDGFTTWHTVILSGAGRAVTITTFDDPPSTGLYPIGLLLDATVTPAGPYAPMFVVGDEVYGQDGTLVTRTVLPVGANEVHAETWGSTYFLGSSSGPTTITIKPATSVAFWSNKAWVYVGEEFELYAAVSATVGYDVDGGTLSIIDADSDEVLGSVAVTPHERDVVVRLREYEGDVRRNFAAVYTGTDLLGASARGLYVDIENGGPTPDTQAPSGTVAINGGATFTNAAVTMLTLSASDPGSGSGVASMRFSATGADGSWSEWETYAQSKPWTLPGADGAKSVYVKFRDGAGNVSAVAVDQITLDTTAPQAVAPAESFTEGATVGQSTVPVRLSYPTTDGLSSVAGYSLDQSSNGGAWASLESLGGASQMTRTLAPGATTYRFRAMAVDGVGNASGWTTGPTFRAVRLQENSANVTYTGAWAVKSNSSALGGKIKSSATAGATARCTFNGRDVAVVMRVGPGLGKAQITVDGASPRTIDLYAPASGWRRLVFAAGFASVGAHSVDIKVLHQKSAASSGFGVVLDAFLVLQ